MNLLPKLRNEFIQVLWKRFRQDYGPAEQLAQFISDREGVVPLDHFAIIELPNPLGEDRELETLLVAIGFKKEGAGYLPDKINDFCWFVEEDAATKSIQAALPKIVLGNFRLGECSFETKRVIERISQLPTLNSAMVLKLAQEVRDGVEPSYFRLLSILIETFTRRPCLSPLTREFQRVQEENELMAWSMLFGREINHFGLSVYALQHFASLEAFNHTVTEKLNFRLNECGGFIVKGGPQDGIAQSATVNTYTSKKLTDGSVTVRSPFLEFVWRFPITASPTSTWKDYFQGFVAKNANRVIESVYRAEA